MSVNVWSQKYLFFVETNTAGCCHLRMSPAVFVKTKTQIFLTKPRDIYSHFWKGLFSRYYQLDIVPRSHQRYVSCRHKHGWRGPDFSESHGWKLPRGLDQATGSTSLLFCKLHHHYLLLAKKLMHGKELKLFEDKHYIIFKAATLAP